MTFPPPYAMDRPTKRFLEFGPFRLDECERLLLRDGEHIPLTPKVFDLLHLLVENNSHTISKDELLDRIWGGVVVEENSLTRNISILRKTLGEDPVTGSYIRTVPKRGYRFEADLHVVLEDEEEIVVERRTNYSVTLHDRREGSSGKRSLVPLHSTHTVIGVAGLALLVTVVGIAATLGLYEGAEGEGQAADANQTSHEQTVHAEAVELYRRGRGLWQTRRATDLHEATMLLEQAVEKDPNFALAHAALADAYAFDVGNWRKADELARRALTLDPNLGEPHASIGFVELFWKWNPAEAELSFKRAIALSPNYATAHHWYAIKLAIDGNFNGSLAEINRAMELEPTSAAINGDLCQILYFLQRYDAAEAQCQTTLSIAPDHISAYRHLSDIYTAQGRYAQAVDALIKSEELAANSSTVPGELSVLRAAFERDGIRGFWRSRLAIAGPDPKGFWVAKWYARLGETDKAVEAIRGAFEVRDFDFPFSFTEPVLIECCGDDRQFQELRALWLGNRDQANR